MRRFDEIADRSVDPSGYRPKRFFNDILKRFFDFLLAIVFLTALLPFFLLLAVVIMLDTPGGALYRGVRTGRHGRPFRVFKFRTMVKNAEKLGGGTTALNDRRITRSGKFLRKSKLDELPQLINIILGDMSFIGPRPELPVYTDRYEGVEKIILDVRPGLTDMSSIRYISLEERVGEVNADEVFEREILQDKNRLRVQYVVRQGFLFDAWLFFQTFFRVIRKIIRTLASRNGIMHVGKHQAEEV